MAPSAPRWRHLGKEPATVDPLFLDEMRDKPNQSYPVKLGDKTFTSRWPT
jgi:hypothetical protein